MEVGGEMDSVSRSSRPARSSEYERNSSFSAPGLKSEQMESDLSSLGCKSVG